MARVRTIMGECVTWDGDNAEELAQLLELEETPEPDEDGQLVLQVPAPMGTVDTTTLAPGDGLVIRDPGFMYVQAGVLASWPDPEPEEEKA